MEEGLRIWRGPQRRLWKGMDIPHPSMLPSTAVIPAHLAMHFHQYHGLSGAAAKRRRPAAVCGNSIIRSSIEAFAPRGILSPATEGPRISRAYFVGGRLACAGGSKQCKINVS